MRFDASITTTCGYFGVGGSLAGDARPPTPRPRARAASRPPPGAHAPKGRVASIRPALDGPANEGHTCLKGRFAHQFSKRRDRLSTPLIREPDGLRPATWDEAIGRIVSELGRIKAE